MTTTDEPVSKHNDGWCGVACPACRGSGYQVGEDDRIMCGRCGGTGERYESHLDLREDQ